MLVRECEKRILLPVSGMFLLKLWGACLCDWWSTDVWSCRAHVAHLIRLRGGTRHGVCQLSEWPEVTLCTAEDPKGQLFDKYGFNELAVGMLIRMLSNLFPFFFSSTGVIFACQPERLSFLFYNFVSFWFLSVGESHLHPYLPAEVSIPIVWLHMICMCLIRTVCVYLIKWP